ncbi:glycosylase [Paenibacillus baekrokdamisoli]|uniref:Glycosylase n=1 Tax=Paenibacillus baekrokdamisoli TaxID=1712516 RepID=A0A3G9J140_9BACL|nr:hypothetical protein [Paenibacillus baekrokdamisoli]MBB3071755.1 putative GH43/DUF377 family glycosyl hydrolase [Paenibacillus baekrokdamisoli]BBH24262.1 glycosylase [Paenibacillus baekrokdamisoli]
MSEQSNERKIFFGDGFFEWQLGGKAHHQEMYEATQYNEERYWGGFSKAPVDLDHYQLPDWAIGPFHKFEGNPIFAPAEEGWDRGRFGGGVHNGAVVRKDGQFYYIYRGEEPLREDFWGGQEVGKTDMGSIDYICDIGVAVSEDGINFVRMNAYNPLFRHGEDADFSFEDVCVVKHEDTYYLYCNKWDWRDHNNPTRNGVFMATSKDLLQWEKVGFAFPEAARIHRNPCVLQNPDNEAVSINGQFVMYINDGLIAYSDDLLHWESEELSEFWPGGEGCFAVTDYSDEHPDQIVLFTGGHHTGHFYAVGEVLLSKDNPGKPLEWLPRPVLIAEEKYPWENARSVSNPDTIISYFRDCIFFTGITRYEGKWMAYYGGSEVYTCLAMADVK